jgi:hypothetical protein
VGHAMTGQAVTHVNGTTADVSVAAGRKGFKAEMNDQARAALEAFKREYPEWNVAFIGGHRARWIASCVYEAPAGYVYVECFSLRALRARMMANDWTVTPKYPLRIDDQPSSLVTSRPTRGA